MINPICARCSASCVTGVGCTRCDRTVNLYSISLKQDALRNLLLVSSWKVVLDSPRESDSRRGAFLGVRKVRRFVRKMEGFESGELIIVDVDVERDEGRSAADCLRQLARLSVTN